MYCINVHCISYVGGLASKLWFINLQSLTQWVAVAIMVVSTVKLVLMTYCVSQCDIASSTARCRMWPTFGEDSEYIYTLYTAVSCPFGLTPRHGHASRIAGHPFIPVPRAAHVYSHGCGCRGWDLCIWWCGSTSWDCLGRSPPTTMQIICYQSVQELVRIPHIGQ